MAVERARQQEGPGHDQQEQRHGQEAERHELSAENSRPRHRNQRRIGAPEIVEQERGDNDSEHEKAGSCEAARVLRKRSQVEHPFPKIGPDEVAQRARRDRPEQADEARDRDRRRTEAAQPHRCVSAGCAGGAASAPGVATASKAMPSGTITRLLNTSGRGANA